MKKILLLLAVFMSAASAFADGYTYTPMFEKGKVWKYDTTILYWPIEGEKRVNTFYTVSVVDGPDENGRFTLRKSFNDEGIGEEYKIQDLYYTVQELNGVVSLCPYEYNDTPWALMDFKMNKGDKTLFTEEGMITEYSDFVTIMDDELITVKGKTYRRLQVQRGSGSSHYKDYWVEGIGSMNKKFLTLIPIPGSYHTPGGIGYWFWGENLNSVYKDGICIFENSDFNATGAAAITTVNSNASAKYDDKIYNLNGAAIGGSHAPGLYIKNGKKIVIK